MACVQSARSAHAGCVIPLPRGPRRASPRRSGEHPPTSAIDGGDRRPRGRRGSEASAHVRPTPLAVEKRRGTPVDRGRGRVFPGAIAHEREKAEEARGRVATSWEAMTAKRSVAKTKGGRAVRPWRMTTKLVPQTKTTASARRRWDGGISADRGRRGGPAPALRRWSHNRGRWRASRRTHPGSRSAPACVRGWRGRGPPTRRPRR